MFNKAIGFIKRMKKSLMIFFSKDSFAHSFLNYAGLRTVFILLVLLTIPQDTSLSLAIMLMIVISLLIEVVDRKTTGFSKKDLFYDFIGIFIAVMEIVLTYF